MVAMVSMVGMLLLCYAYLAYLCGWYCIHSRLVLKCFNTSSYTIFLLGGANSCEVVLVYYCCATHTWHTFEVGIKM